MAASDLQVSLVGTSGDTVTVSVYNPQTHSETARIQITVTLTSGDSRTLTSPNFTIGAGDTKSVQIVAAGPIASITDGPEPVDPL